MSRESAEYEKSFLDNGWVKVEITAGTGAFVFVRKRESQMSDEAGRRDKRDAPKVAESAPAERE